MKLKLIPFLLAAQLFASDGEEIDPDLLRPVQQAAALLETGQYSLADEFYQYLLQGSLKPWERAIVMDNFVSVLLAEGKEDLALETLKAIPSDPSIDAWLRPRMERQRALAYIQQAAKGDPLKSGEVLVQAQKEEEIAQSSYCALAQREGYSSCPSQPEFGGLTDAIASEQGKLRQRVWEQRIEKGNYQETLNTLSEGIERLQSDLSFLQKVPEKDLQTDYREAVSAQTKQGRLVWAALKKQLPKKSENALEKKRAALVEEAAKSYAKGVADLKKGDIKESSESLQATTEALKALKAMPPPPPPPAPQEAPEEAPSTPPPQKEIDKTLQQLVELENEDKHPPVPVVPARKVARPW